MCVTTKTRPLNRLGQLGEFEQDSNADPELGSNTYTHSAQLAVYVIRFRLHCRVIHGNDEPFDFTAALHSYFEILKLAEANVRGLKGLQYLDKSDDPTAPAEKTEDREQVTFGDKLVDSV